ASRVRWAHETAIPEIARLAAKGDDQAAMTLAKKADAIIPRDPALERLWPEMSFEISVNTEPTGAQIYVKEYRAGDGPWEYAGLSPVQHLKVPFGQLRWKAEKQGFQTAEALSFSVSKDRKVFPGTLNLQLDPRGIVPEGMVRVAGGEIDVEFPGMERAVSVVTVPDYWMDRYEVTNQGFKQFVDAGGYRRTEYWKNPFVEKGEILTWEAAMARFRDKAGRPGPAIWELGSYPEGQDNYPVTGVSWYEAAAYAEFAGKSLPTVHQWRHAAETWWTSDVAAIAALSNFGGTGLAAVGSHPSLSPYGTYDMAGNAKEWTWNSTGDKRFILDRKSTRLK